MNRIMEDIAKLTDGQSFQSYKYSFDSVRTPSPDYDDTPDQTTVWNTRGETLQQKNTIDLADYAKQLVEICPEPRLRYFLDGSRHVYHVDDIAYSSRVFPVVAGQVGVACCYRENKRLRVGYPPVSKLVISLPNMAITDEKYHMEQCSRICDKVNENAHLRRLGGHYGHPITFSDILTYRTDDITRGDFKDRGIATIQDYMIDAEKGMVDAMAKDGLLSQDAYLVKDGTIEYIPMKTGKYADIRTFKNSYRWVIGVSKSFNPENCRDGKGRDGKGKPNADAIISLKQFHRTQVAKIKTDRIPDLWFAVWYIRLRKFPEQTRNPFDGVIKVEKILVTDEEIANGLDSDTVDMLSASLINERCPTCYGADLRFANHLYPVYLTESYIKSTYMSGEMFISLF